VLKFRMTTANNNGFPPGLINHMEVVERIQDLLIEFKYTTLYSNNEN